MAHKPLSIKRQDTGVQIEWSDLGLCFIDVKKLRLACPCASCQGESDKPLTESNKKSPFLIVENTIEEETKLLGIQAVGNYAIKVLWGDGHDTGIYTYKLLYELSAASEK